MSAAYDIEQKTQDAFASVDELYEEIKAELRGSMLDETEAEVERQLAERGNELMRQLMQSHVTLRGMAACTEDVIGADGVERTHRIRSGRNLETLWGCVRVERRGYGLPGHETLFPTDADLNLPRRKYSHELAHRLAHSVAKESFDEALRTLSMHTGADIPKRQAELLMQEAARNFDAFYTQHALQVDPDATGEILALSFDCAGIHVYEEDLRESTRKERKRRSRTRRRPGERRKSGKKRARRRQAALGTVFTQHRHSRTLEDLLEGKAPDAPRPEFKTSMATICGDVDDIVERVFAEASRRDPQRNKTWVALVDGAPNLKNAIKRAAARYDVDVVIIYDLMHVLNYLWKAAYAFHEPGSDEAYEWVHHRLRMLLEGKASYVAAGMRQSATKRGLDEKAREPVDKCAKYLLNHTDGLVYDDVIEQGLPIATGVIEGACRHLVRDRMDISGARWRLNTAEAVLRLRALLANGDLDLYWRFHEELELQRNHTRKYADESPPELLKPGQRPDFEVIEGGVE